MAGVPLDFLILLSETMPMITAGMPVRKLQKRDRMPVTSDQMASLLVLEDAGGRA